MKTTHKRLRAGIELAAGRRDLTDQGDAFAPSTVFVIGLDYHVKDAIDWTDAVVGLLGRFDEGARRWVQTYSPFKDHPTRRVRSAGGTVDMPWPLIVRLNHWVQIPHHKVIDPHARASRLDILYRDGWTCGYCAGFATTIDHVFPISRGGPSTFGNLVAACIGCNSDKADQTPEEAGMKLLWSPRGDDTRFAGVQAEVWRILAADLEPVR